MAVATSSRRVSSVRPSRGAALTFSIIGALILAGYFGLSLLYERVKPNQHQIFAALAETPFEQRVPEPLVPGSTRDVSKDRAVFVHLTVDDAKAAVDIQPGNPVVIISYFVHPDASDAARSLEEKESSYRVTAALRAGPDPSGEEWNLFSLPISEQHLCLEITNRARGAEAYCQFAVGKVLFEVLSYTKQDGISDDHHLPELSRAAIAHLREAVPGID